MEDIVGFVKSIVFHQNDTGFSIFTVQTKEHEAVVVKGTIPALKIGQEIYLEGAWTMHPKFGRQFEAQKYTLTLPKTISGLKKYLGSGAIKGIGPAYAEKLVNYFGTNVLSVIDNDPEQLSNVPGIGPKRIELIIEAWKQQKEVAAIMVFLQEKNVTTSHASKIYKSYGHRSIEIISENPYRISEEIWGIGFATADALAQQLGFAPESVERIKAGILYIITDHTSTGNLYIELDLLRAKTLELLSLSVDTAQPHLKAALYDLYHQGKMKLITHENKHYTTLSQYYFSEKGVASKIEKLLAHQSTRAFNMQEIYTKIRTTPSSNIELNEAQQKGIMSCLQSKIAIITGGPGTGKTTLLKELLNVLDEHKCSYKLAAPTGRAAKRITESTGRYATTLHRLLEFNPNGMGFSYNEQNALQLEYLIVDEASMLDIFLAHALLKAVPLTAHIIFLGDVDQLPSVGAGNFLHDLIDSAIIPVTRLSYIFRQAENSLIAYNAHRINSGEFPAFKAQNTFQDYFFIREEDPEKLPLILQKIYQETLKKFGLRTKQAIVLTPMNRGSAGTITLNHHLQKILNDQQTESISRVGYTFKINDPIMQMKNNYDKHVFNGDIGTIDSINAEDQKLSINFGGRSIEYDFLELDEISLAYATSIHKSQGSEFDAVIIPIFTQHFTLLQRNLLYTALTRAKKCCIIIGQMKAVAIAIRNNKILFRQTFLKEFLTTNLICQ